MLRRRRVRITETRAHLGTGFGVPTRLHYLLNHASRRVVAQPESEELCTEPCLFAIHLIQKTIRRSPSLSVRGSMGSISGQP